VAWTIGKREFPARTYLLILTNDLSLWFPSLAYLLHRAVARRQVIALTCVVSDAAARGLSAIGLALDLASETIAVLTLTGSTATLDRLGRWAGWATLLGAVMANGLGCVGDAALSIVSWRTGLHRGTPALLAAGVWMSGSALSTALLARQPSLMVVFGASVMGLFMPCVLLTAPRLRCPAHRS
jgi:hypothetical protein